MEILGVGPEELLFILIIALILLGPRDMQKAGKTVGRWLRKLVTSDGWKLFQQTSREIQILPNRLMREAQLDELKDIQKDIKKDLQQAVGTMDQATQISPSAADPAGIPTRETTVLPSPVSPAPPAEDQVKDA